MSLVLFFSITLAVPLLLAVGFWLSGFEEPGDFFGVVSFCIFCLFLLWAPSVFYAQYHTSIYLPRKIHQKQQAIEEAQEMLVKTKKGDSAKMAKGLEGLKIKATITKLIDKKRKMLANYKGKMENPWMFFKPRPIPNKSNIN